MGETAVSYEINGQQTVIDNVWSQQGLEIAGGTSGAPVVSEEDDAIVAVACAGADALNQAFFVPLPEKWPGKEGAGRLISDVIASAKDAATRLGRNPNRSGLALLAGLPAGFSMHGRSFADLLPEKL